MKAAAIPQLGRRESRRKGHVRLSTESRRPAWRSATLWSLAAISAGSLLAYYCFWLARLPQMDFLVYRMAGGHVVGGGLYSSHITALGRSLVFIYPPVSALFFWPFSLVAPHVAQIIWDIVDVGALTALMAVSLAAARSRPVNRSDWRTALILLAPVGFLLWPVRYDLNLGQINLLLVLMIVTDLTVVWTARVPSLPRGVLVGAAGAVKLTPLIFVPYLIASRQWKAARNAILTFAAVTGAMFVVAPRSSWLYFTKYMTDTARAGNEQGLSNQTLITALHRAHLHMASVVDLIALAVLCAGIALAAAAYRRSSPLLGLLVCAATGLLISPVSEIHHYVWIVPGLIWLAVGTDRPPRGEWWALAGSLAYMVIPPFTSGGSGAIWYVRDNAYVMATLVFLGLVAVLLWRRGRSFRGDTAEARSPDQQLVQTRRGQPVTG
jgi:alpha-1,2-mannosyltransferase